MTKILRLLFIMLIMCVALTIHPVEIAHAQVPDNAPPAPVLDVTQDNVTVSFFFDNLAQGTVGVVRVTGDSLTEVRGRFLDAIIEFIPTDDGYYALLATSISQTARTYILDVVALRGEGDSVTLALDVPVTVGPFISETITVPETRSYLVSPEIERAEFARLDSIVGTVTEEILWDDAGFAFPIASELTSPFGSYRVFNETTEARHTGWDLRAGIGIPVMAMASGRVAFAGLLDIRGNHVIIDHGYGIFSGYSHFSQVHVTQGQTVSAGQVLGTVGTTGRSSGAHLHWEMMVNGYFVDPVIFTELWLPQP